MLTSIAGSYKNILPRKEGDGDAPSERIDRLISIRSTARPRRQEEFSLDEFLTGF
jgi:hypothetical protein